MCLLEQTHFYTSGTCDPLPEILPFILLQTWPPFFYLFSVIFHPPPSPLLHIYFFCLTHFVSSSHRTVHLPVKKGSAFTFSVWRIRIVTTSERGDLAVCTSNFTYQALFISPQYSQACQALSPFSLFLHCSQILSHILHLSTDLKLSQYFFYLFSLSLYLFLFSVRTFCTEAIIRSHQGQWTMYVFDQKNIFHRNLT